MDTKHSMNCTRVFNRYDLTCRRCQELANGQPARAGWNDAKRQQEARQIAAIRAHDFMACTKQYGVCTHFEW